MADADESTGSTGRRSKVARLIDEYDLDGIGAEMERRWTAPDDERTSLRDLATHFNQRLLAAAMATAGLQPLSGEIENTYQLLTDEETSSADRTQTRRQLERDGVPVEELQSDFVTYQAIRSYLIEHRGAEYTADDRDRTVVEAENVQRLRGRVETVTEEKLDRLRRNTEFDLGEFMLFVDVSVLCEDCGQRYGIDELLERGGCDCTTPSD
ncbi:rod-determining factor RdfA [Halococcus thailandensis]|nr:rod-determining factor RdfA [Halococcus thailandensis]